MKVPPHRAETSPRWRPPLPWRNLSSRVACILATLCGTHLPHGHAGESPAPVSPERLRLSQLSLEELLETEITPINVLGSHTHLRGEFMLGYAYSFEHFGGNLDGTHEASAADVFAQGYALHHTWMDMQMQMLEVMYAPRDRWTLMGMSRFTQMSMGHLQKSDGKTFTTKSEGIGDTEVTAMYTLLGNPRGNGHRLLLKGGLSLPTGAIDKTYFHDGSAKHLEYPMQLGSGTFDLLPGVMYLGSTHLWSWGAEALGTARLGENDRNYRLGDRFQLDAWGHYKITEWLGSSLRLEWKRWGNIHGADPVLVSTVNPAFDPKKQSGERMDFLTGLHLYVNRGPLKGLRFSTEGGTSVYQNLAGPNLKSDWMINVNLNYVFR